MRGTSEQVYFTRMPSPLGDILVASSEVGVCRITIPNEREEDFFAWIGQVFGHEQAVVSDEHNRPVVEQLQEYLDGRRREFELPLDLRGTSFQRRVWGELLRIPYGGLCSYQDVAAAIGSPRACRAVGGAVGKNPLPIIVPCHRVIGKDGSLTGFGSGLDTKRFLLRLEGSLWEHHN